MIIIQVALAFLSLKDRRPMPKIGEVDRLDLRKLVMSDEKIAAIDKAKKAEADDSEAEPYNFWQINKASLFVAWVVILFHISIARKLSSKLDMRNPGRLQILYEMIVEIFDELTTATLGSKKLGRVYLPLIMTLFIYIITCNWIGILPPVWQIIDKEEVLFQKNETTAPTVLSEAEHLQLKAEWKNYKTQNKKDILFAKYLEEIKNKDAQNGKYILKYEPFLPEWISTEEPTQDLNTTLGLGLMVFVIVFISAYKKHGFMGIIKELSAPFVILLPLNIIGEAGKLISHSFRLFGNIKGGAIIFIVVTYLTFNVLLPIPMFLYLGMFAGAVQALVFSMLALVYVAMWVAEEQKEATVEHKPT